jgi:hypothetical protein
MSTNKLDEFIRAERERPLPDCPQHIDRRVLLRVRETSYPSEEISRLDWLFGPLPRFRLAASALALTLVLSVGTSLTLSKRSVDSLDSQRLAASALGFDVFHHSHVLNLEP